MLSPRPHLGFAGSAGSLDSALDIGADRAFVDIGREAKDRGWESLPDDIWLENANPC